jgi:hypothetical protein
MRESSTIAPGKIADLVLLGADRRPTSRTLPGPERGAQHMATTTRLDFEPFAEKARGL